MKKRKTLAIFTTLCLTGLLACSKKEPTRTAFSDNVTSFIVKMDDEYMLTILENVISNNPNFQQTFAESCNPKESAAAFYCHLLPFLEVNKDNLTLEHYQRICASFYEADFVIFKPELIEIFYNMLNGEKQEIDGITHAYAESVVEHYCPSFSIHVEGAQRWFEKLICYIPQEVVATYMFTTDRAGLIEELKKCYYLEDTKQIEELFLLYDEWYAYNDWNFVDYVFYDGRSKRLDAICDKIKSIQDAFLMRKLTNDPDFLETFGGQIAYNYLMGKQDYYDYTYPNIDPVFSYLGGSSISGENYMDLTIENISWEQCITYQEAIHAQALLEIESINSHSSAHFRKRLFDLIGEKELPLDLSSVVQSLMNLYPNQFYTTEETEEFLVALSVGHLNVIEKYNELLEQGSQTPSRNKPPKLQKEKIFLLNSE